MKNSSSIWKQFSCKNWVFLLYNQIDTCKYANWQLQFNTSKL